MWSTRASGLKYEPFHEALKVGTEKINEYYQKTADSDAYTFAMHTFFIFVCSTRRLTILVLNLTQKANHIKRYWGKDLYGQTIKEAENIVSFLIFHSLCRQLRNYIV